MVNFPATILILKSGAHFVGYNGDQWVNIFCYIYVLQRMSHVNETCWKQSQNKQDGLKLLFISFHKNGLLNNDFASSLLEHFGKHLLV